jgi:hypothetical protein
MMVNLLEILLLSTNFKPSNPNYMHRLNNKIKILRFHNLLKLSKNPSNQLPPPNNNKLNNNLNNNNNSNNSSTLNNNINRILLNSFNNNNNNNLNFINNNLCLFNNNSNQYLFRASHSFLCLNSRELLLCSNSLLKACIILCIE